MKKIIILFSLIIFFLMLGIINLWSSRQRLVGESTKFEELLDKLNIELDGCLAVIEKYASADTTPKTNVIIKEVPKIVREPEVIIEYVDVIRECKRPDCPKMICPKCPRYPICLPENHRLWLGGLSVDTRLGLIGHIGYDWRSEYLFTCGPAIDQRGAFGIHATVLRRF